MTIQNRPVLMLDKGFQWYDATTLKDAFCKVMANHAQFVDEYVTYDIDSWCELPVDGHDVIATASKSIRVPTVMRFESFTKDYSRCKVVFSRKNLWKRDNYRCQYCGCKPRPDEITVDHVVPQTQGGISCFENCVLSCVKCNLKKGGRTPEQAGMQLRRSVPGSNGIMKVVYYDRPAQPAWSPLYNLPKLSKFPESWKDYIQIKHEELYWHVTLES